MTPNVYILVGYYRDGVHPRVWGAEGTPIICNVAAVGSFMY